MRLLSWGACWRAAVGRGHFRSQGRTNERALVAAHPAIPTVPMCGAFLDTVAEGDDRRRGGKDHCTGQAGSELRTPFLQPESWPVSGPIGGRVSVPCDEFASPRHEPRAGSAVLDSRIYLADLRLAAGDRCSAVTSPRWLSSIERPPGRTRTTQLGTTSAWPVATLPIRGNASCPIPSSRSAVMSRRGWLVSPHGRTPSGGSARACGAGPPPRSASDTRR